MELDEATDVAKRAAEATAEARTAAERALDYARAAQQAQVRIKAHNDDCENRWPWSRPANWKKVGGSGRSYRGYTTLHGGQIVPHGEGESSHPVVKYRCAKFDHRLVAGLMVQQFSNGSTAAGHYIEAEGVAEMSHVDTQMSASYIGRWVTDGDTMSLKVGTLVYPDKSTYYGYCAHIDSLDHVAPAGFGAWSRDEQITVLAYFNEGLAEGAGLIRRAGSGDYAATFSAGRVTGLSGRPVR